MKKSIIILIGLLCVGLVSAGIGSITQLKAYDSNGLLITDDGDNTGIFIKDGGNVGIGTTAPSQLLEVSQIGTVNGVNVKVIAGEGKSSALELIADEGDDNGDLWLVASDKTTNSMIWYNDVSGSNVAKMTLTSGGNVGIGTTAPTEILEVNGNIQTRGTTAQYNLHEIAGPDNYMYLQLAGGILRISNSSTPGVDDFLTVNSATEVVNVLGELTAGTKTFKIDNPENPLNEYLRHVNVENPEAIVTYRGQADTQQTVDYDNEHGWSYTAQSLGNNKIKVTLPSWFNDLTRNSINYKEYTGQVTGIKSFCGDAYFDFDSVDSNIIYITTEKTCQMSWIIQATRHDPFYEANIVDVVEQKEDIPVYTEEVTEYTETVGDDVITYEKTEYIKNDNAKGTLRHDLGQAVITTQKPADKVKELKSEKVKNNKDLIEG